MSSYFNIPLNFNLDEEVLRNQAYRWVVNTTPDMQLVLMSIEPFENINEECHEVSQFIKVVSGCMQIIINGKQEVLYDGSVALIPPNTLHAVNNVGNIPLKIYTIYANPLYPINLVLNRKNSEPKFLKTNIK